MTRILWHEMIKNSDEILLKLCDEQKKYSRKIDVTTGILSLMFKASLPQFTMNKYQVWYGLKLNAWLKLFNLFTIFFNFPSRSFCFLPKKRCLDDYWVENMLRKLKGFLKFSSISKVGGYPGLFPIPILNLTSYGLHNKYSEA